MNLFCRIVFALYDFQGQGFHLMSRVLAFHCQSCYSCVNVDMCLAVSGSLFEDRQGFSIFRDDGEQIFVKGVEFVGFVEEAASLNSVFEYFIYFLVQGMSGHAQQLFSIGIFLSCLTCREGVLEKASIFRIGVVFNSSVISQSPALCSCVRQSVQVFDAVLHAIIPFPSVVLTVLVLLFTSQFVPPSFFYNGQPLGCFCFGIPEMWLPDKYFVQF